MSVPRLYHIRHPTRRSLGPPVCGPLLAGGPSSFNIIGRPSIRFLKSRGVLQGKYVQHMDALVPPMLHVPFRQLEKEKGLIRLMVAVREGRAGQAERIGRCWLRIKIGLRSRQRLFRRAALEERALAQQLPPPKALTDRRHVGLVRVVPVRGLFPPHVPF